MTCKEFIKFLDTNEIRYKHELVNGIYDFVYVYGETEKIIDPFDHTVRDYVPYLRVTHFGSSSGLYTRDNGLCGWKNEKWVKNRCIELKEGR